MIAFWKMVQRLGRTLGYLLSKKVDLPAMPVWQYLVAIALVIVAYGKVKDAIIEALTPPDPEPKIVYVDKPYEQPKPQDILVPSVVTHYQTDTMYVRDCEAPPDWREIGVVPMTPHGPVVERTRVGLSIPVAHDGRVTKYTYDIRPKEKPLSFNVGIAAVGEPTKMNVAPVVSLQFKKDRGTLQIGAGYNGQPFALVQGFVRLL